MVGVGEMLVSAVVKEVSSKLGSAIWEEIRMLKDFNDDLIDLKKTFEMVQAVLSDAEMRSIKEKAVCLWLKELKFIAYDIEDIMCDFEAKISTNKGNGWLEKLRKTLFSPKLAMERYTLANEIKNMRKQLRLIADRRTQFGLSIGIGYDNQEVIKQRETVGYLERESVIVGREKEKEKIINWLLNESDGTDLSIVSIVGIGGLGKTTLVKMVYNDERIKKYFLKQAWVYVSMEFDLKRIGEAIISETRETERSNMDNLQNVFRCIREDLNCKFLIVLDDVWSEDEENLKNLKSMINCGCKGSKIIVTSRSENVSFLMGGLLHHLEPLNDNDCWELVKRKLYRHHNEKIDYFQRVDIVERCNGIPLVANSLGNLIRAMGGLDSWTDIKDSNIWKFVDDESRPEIKVLNWLKLSYYHMPSYLKVCFAYCAIFPKGFKINSYRLIYQWIAMGYIKQSHDNLAPEKIGEMYINSLVGMSFFQSLTHLGIVYIYMHDLIHDLAKSIVGDELLVLTDGMAINAGFKNKHCRYVLVKSIQTLANIFPAFHIKVRALHFHHCCWKVRPRILFSHTRCLRVLDFNGSWIDYGSIFNLDQLRYLDTTGTNIRKMPKSISHHNNIYFLNLSIKNSQILFFIFDNFHNLSHLEMRYTMRNASSSLEEMPKSFSKLKLLRYLELFNFTNLKSLPESIGELSYLRILKLPNCCSLEKLPKSLTTLANLEHLDLSYCEKLNELPENLGLLHNLQVVNLFGCFKIESLPSSIGNLAKLEILHLRSRTKFKKFQDSFDLIYVKDNPRYFTKNTNTNPGMLRGFDELWENFPFSNVDLINLQTLPIYVVSNVTTQSGVKCSNIGKLRHLNQLHGSLKIKCLENVFAKEEAENANLCNKKKINSLELEWTRNGDFKPNSRLDELVLEKLQPHNQLITFTLRGYRDTKFPRWLVDLSSLPKLVNVTISDLPNLEILPVFGQLEYLENLNIELLPNVRRIYEGSCPDGQAFRKLKQLRLINMLNLEMWWVSLCNNNVLILSNIKAKIHVSDCPKLRVRPFLLQGDVFCITWGGLLASIENCVGSLPIFRKLCIDFEWRVPDVAVLDEVKMLQALSMVHELRIKNCKEMGVLLPCIRFLTALQSLKMDSCYDKVLPQWLGDLTLLNDLEINHCFNLDTLRHCIMQKLTYLKKLNVRQCSDIFFERCSGVDKTNIIHIQEVTIEPGTGWHSGEVLAWNQVSDLSPSSGSSSNA